MRHSFKMLLALLLALALVLSLAACSKEDEGGNSQEGGNTAQNGETPGENGGGSGKTPGEDADPGENGEDGPDRGPDPADVIASSPEEDPLAYLQAAFEVTAADLARRYAGSPTTALRDVMDRTGRFDLSFTLPAEDGTNIAVSCALAYDVDAATARLDAAANMEDVMEFSGSAYFSRDFVGVQVPMIFGDDTFYGMQPHDFYDQVSGSILAQGMTPEGLEAFRELDRLIDAFSEVELPDSGAMEAQYKEFLDSLSGNMELSSQESSGKLNGADAQGWKITGTMDSNQLADVMDKLFDLVLDSPVWDTLEDIAQAGGSELEMDFSRDELDEQLQEIRGSDASCEFEFLILDGRVTGITVICTNNVGEDAVAAVDLYNEGAVTFTFTADGETAAFSAYASSEDGYESVITAIVDSEAVTMTTTWDETGYCNLTVTTPEGTIGAGAHLTVEDGGFVLSDLSAFSSLTVLPDSETIDAPLTLTYTSNAAPEAPETTKNFFDLTEEDYEYLAEIFQLNGMA